MNGETVLTRQPVEHPWRLSANTRSTPAPAPQFDPRRILGNQAIAQQAGGVAPAIQRGPDKPGKVVLDTPSIVMIVAYRGSKSSAVATLSDDTVEPVKITQNTLEPGEYTFKRDPSAPLHYRLEGQVAGQQFVWIRKQEYGWADMVRVFIRLSPEEKIRALPPHIRDFLTTTRSGAEKASAADLASIASAGRILEEHGVTEDELSLLELAHADKRGVGLHQEQGGDPVGFALAFVEGRQAAAGKAQSTRDVLQQNAQRFDSPWRWRENPAAEAFERALEVEVRAVATSILNATEAAIYRMDRRFIGAYQTESLGPGFLSDQLGALRADEEIQKARKALQLEQDWKPPRPPSGEKEELEEQQRKKQYYQEGRSSAYEPWHSREHVRRHAIRLRLRRDELNELVRVKTGSGLQLGTLARADAEQLLSAKTPTAAYGVLRDMLYHGRVAVRDARGRLDNPKALFGADIVIATEKLLLGVKPGSVVDQIIDDIVRDRTAPSVWERILDVVSLVAEFIPGPFGVAIRTAVATVQAVLSVERFAGRSTLHGAGLASVDPSGGGLVADLIITAGGVVLDKATAVKAAGRGRLVDLGDRAPAPAPPRDPVATTGGPPEPPVASGHPPGGTAPPEPTEMRGVQIADEPRSIQIRPPEVPVPATAAELTALRNTEVTALGRRADLTRDLHRSRLERGGLREIEGGALEELGGLRGQIAKRDELLEGGTLSTAGKAKVRGEIDELQKKLDATDAQITKLEAELSKADEELTHVRARLRNEGPALAGQQPQLAAGRLRESEVGEAYSLGPKNNQRMRDPNPGGADFIPDHVAGNPASLVWGRPYHFREIKDWADMSDTGNLSAMLDYVANTSGARLTIYYRNGTYMSGPLRTRIEGLMRAGRVDLVPFVGP